MDIIQKLTPGFHLAIIMDGNGRWAEARGVSRLKGHEAGMSGIEALYEAATDFGVDYLTLFAFSTENWRRTRVEVEGLMRLFQRYLDEESERLLGKNVRVRFIGDKTAFSDRMVAKMNDLETKTAQNTGLHLQIAMNYGGQDEIARAVNAAIAAGHNVMTPELIGEYLDTSDCPPVDLLVRTSGEQRISNFVLWQSAYAELYFTDTLWPDFDREALGIALAAFFERERRFGGNAA